MTTELDYWKVAGALNRALVELGKDRGEDVSESALNLLVIELDQVYPTFDWANTLTDSWPRHHA
jgi:hypothetical protein